MVFTCLIKFKGKARKEQTISKEQYCFLKAQEYWSTKISNNIKLVEARNQSKNSRLKKENAIYWYNEPSMTKITKLVDKAIKNYYISSVGGKSRLNMLNKDVNFLKIRMELPEVKNTIIIMKNSLDGSNRLLDTVKEKISEYEDIVMEIKQNKTQGEKMTEKKLNKASVSSGENSGSSNISLKSLKKKRGQRLWSVQKSHSL